MCECGFTTCLALSHGLTKIGWGVAFVLLSIVSFGLVTLAAQKIPLGTAYAVWTGIGAFGTALIGIICVINICLGLTVGGVRGNWWFGGPFIFFTLCAATISVATKSKLPSYVLLAIGFLGLAFA